MAMTVMNNNAVALTLGEFNKNLSHFGKDLKKISNGVKVVDASDNASAYSISEKMRIMLRSIEQDIKNSQTGMNVIKIAESGIQEIVNSLREMKKMAICSVNDSNTNQDRATIQKEFIQSMNTINDIASTTNYNGKNLFDGNYWYEKIHSKTRIYSEAQSEVETSLTKKNIVSKNYSYDETALLKENTIENLIPTGNTLLKEWYISRRWAAGKFGYVPSSIGRETSYDPYQGIPQSVARYGITLNFSQATKNGVPITFPDDLDGQGITMACQDRGTCPVYCSFIFDSSMSVGKGKILSLQHGDSQAVYVLGIKEATTADKAEEAVFLGIKNLTDEFGWDQLKTSPAIQKNNLARVVNGWNHDLKIVKNGDDYTLSMREFEIWLYNGTKGITVTVNDEEPYDSDAIVPTDDYTETDASQKFKGEPFIIHYGIRSNQHLKIYFNNMHTRAMGIEDEEVSTSEKALEAIPKLDKALEYALNEYVRMGAYETRLEKIIDTCVINQEHIMNAESVIRDADIAKEITNYTKNNILVQFSQSMLAQANQNSETILSLLQ